MKGDQWHNGKFTVVPKVSANIGLNFLDCSAQEYLEVIARHLSENGHKADKPLAFLCNPPYRGRRPPSLGIDTTLRPAREFVAALGPAGVDEVY